MRSSRQCEREFPFEAIGVRVNASTGTILVVHHDADLYGADKSLLWSVRALVAGGFEPIVVVPTSGPLVDILRSEGFEVHIGAVGKTSRALRSPLAWLRFAAGLLASFRFLDQVVGKRRISLVYSNSIAVLGGAFWGMVRRVPRMLHVREIIASPRLVSLGYPRLLRLLGNYCVCNSNATRDWLVAGSPALAARSVVVWNGLEGVSVPHADAIAAFRVGLGLAAGDVLVTLVGRVNRWKGQALFIEAAAALKAQGLRGAKFLIVGDVAADQQHLREAMLEKIRVTDIGDMVVWRPFTAEVDLVWAASNIAVVPSIDPEPFGRVVIEAMAHGLPVIASAHGGPLEIVVHQETGLLVPPRDAARLAQAVSQLIMSPELRHSYGACGRERQRALFSQAAHDRALLSIVRTLCKIEQIPNVLFVHHAVDMYGSDKVLLYLASALKARGNFYPFVILPQRGLLFDALVRAGVEVRVSEVAKISRSVMSISGVGRLAGMVWRSVRALDRIVAKRPIALVHSNTLAVLGGAAWAWRRGVPHVWHVHEIILSPRLISRAFPLLVRAFSDRVMSNSTLTEAWLLKEQPRLGERSVVVFNGLPPVQVPAREAVAAFRARIGAAPDDIVVTLAGRLNSWKGQGLLIEAAGLLQGRGKLAHVRFAIVGDAVPGQEWLREQLIAQAANVGLTSRFCFVPFVDDIAPVWFASQVAVVPSTEPEPFGLVAIEAMAASLPVVAAAHGGLLDIVQHEKTGLLFEPRSAGALANALERLIADAALRQALGAEGARRQREVFSFTSQVEKIEQVYREMLHV
jgi:glycosyltransferase involved in cell wall biosynthesis